MRQTPLPPPTRLLRFGIAACTLVVVVLLIYLTYISPRKRVITLADTTSKHLPEMRSRLDDVSTSLQSMLDLVTGKSVQTKPNNSLLLRLNILQVLAQLKEDGPGAVAGADTQTNSTFAPLQHVSSTFNNLADTIRGRVSSKSVLGESSVDIMRINGLRKLKDMAIKGNDDQEKAETKLIEMQAVITSSDMRNLSAFSDVRRDITDNNNLAQKYLAEARKTFSYYSQITDVQIKLVPMLVSYNSLLYEYVRQPSSSLYSSRLRDLKTTSSVLESQVSGITVSDLPEGMADLHKDNIKTIDIVKENIYSVDNAIAKNDRVALANALDQFSADLQPYANRAVVLELNFWQNNTAIHKHDIIVSEYRSEESDLSKIKAANKLPF